MRFYGGKKKKTYRFIKILILTLLSCSLVVGTAIFLVSRNIRPPDIPPIAVAAPIEVQDGEAEEYDDSERRAPLRFTDEDRKDDFFTFMVLGLTEGQNANTIMVLSYDAVNQEANLVSIPRDSLVNANRSVRKINAAYPLGMLHGGGVEGGIQQMQREMMSVIGFIPDFYIVIDYTAFESIIDVIGGVEIYVPFLMRYDDPCQNLHIHLQPGLQQMDGRTALLFSRFRMSNAGYRAITDYERIENQQAVINAALANLLRPANLIRIPAFIDIFNENVYTNLTGWDMLWLADELNAIRGTEALSSHTVPTIGSSGHPMWYEILDGPGIVDLVNRTINPFVWDIELEDLDIITQ